MSIVCSLIVGYDLGLSCAVVTMGSAALCVIGSRMVRRWILLTGAVLGLMIVGLYIAALVALGRYFGYADFNKYGIYYSTTSSSTFDPVVLALVVQIIDVIILITMCLLALIIRDLIFKTKHKHSKRSGVQVRPTGCHAI